MSSEDLGFEDLVVAIEQTHAAFAAQAGKAVNISLTLRNWFIGHRIAEYELVGADRASYGERLIEQLADRLGQTGLKRLDARELRRFLQFYRAYPQIREALSPVLSSLPSAGPFTLPSIRETPTPESGALLPAGPGPRLSQIHTCTAPNLPFTSTGVRPGADIRAHLMRSFGMTGHKLELTLRNVGPLCVVRRCISRPGARFRELRRSGFIGSE